MSGSNPHPGSGNRLSVTRVNEVVLVEVIGLGNMFLAPTLQAFVESELNGGITSFVIDLGQCDGMDSTFMGTFIGLSTKVEGSLGWFCLVNVSEENRRLLKMLGVIHLVKVHDGLFPKGAGKAVQLYPTSDTFARQKQIYEAHRNLVEANPENNEIFGPYLEALETELGIRAGFPKIIPPPTRNGSSTGQNG